MTLTLTKLAVFICCYLVLGMLLHAFGRGKVFLVWLLPLLVLDCLGCLLAGGSWRNTLSGECWNNRDRPRWMQLHEFVDTLFSDGHCEAQALREAQYGSVWRAWRVEFSPPPGKEGST